VSCPRRSGLKAELGAFYPLLLLRPLEAERAEPGQLAASLGALAKLCGQAQFLVRRATCNSPTQIKHRSYTITWAVRSWPPCRHISPMCTNSTTTQPSGEILEPTGARGVPQSRGQAAGASCLASGGTE
jgi:hypothetical protein